jgi:uncharacterized protein YdeI (YjbR/CyaY-like superfamily)
MPTRIRSPGEPAKHSRIAGATTARYFHAVNQRPSDSAAVCKTTLSMKMPKTLYVTDLDSWGTWLARNHDRETEIWLLFYKKHTGQPNLPYEVAVQEALCFGWIDSLVQRIDDARYARKFTPRKAGSCWSVTNQRRVKKLIREARMTTVGLAKIPRSVLAGKKEGPKVPKRKATLPSFLQQSIQGNKKAWKNFVQLARSYQQNYIRWILAAKKRETQQRRLKEAILLLAQGRKLGLK